MSHVLSNDFNRDLTAEIEGSWKQIDEMSQLQRLLVEDSNTRITIKDGVVIKIVRKREAELCSSISDDIEPSNDPNDVYANPEKIEPIGHITNDAEGHFTNNNPTFTPKDKWDLIYDISNLLPVIKMKKNELINIYKYEGKEAYQEALEKIIKENSYCADWFPYPSIKKNSLFFRIIKKRIDQGITKQQLFNILRNTEEKKPIKPNRRLTQYFNITSRLKDIEQEQKGVSTEKRAELLREKKHLTSQMRALNKSSLKPSGSFISTVLGPKEKEILWGYWAEKNNNNVLPLFKYQLKLSGKLLKQAQPQMDILKAKLSKGEIDKKEYKTLVKKIYQELDKKIKEITMKHYGKEGKLVGVCK